MQAGSVDRDKVDNLRPYKLPAKEEKQRRRRCNPPSKLTTVENIRHHFCHRMIWGALAFSIMSQGTVLAFAPGDRLAQSVKVNGFRLVYIVVGGGCSLKISSICN